MAKVNNTEIYKYDDMPTLLDFLLGTDVGNNRKTRSYKLKGIVDLVNGTNGVNGIQYYFSDGSDENIDYNTQGYFFTDTNEVSPEDFTKLIFNKKTETGLNLSVLFDFFGATEDLVLKIANPSDPNNFLHFKITAITDDENYVTFDLENNVSLGLLSNGFVYSIYWDVNSGGGNYESSDTIEFTETTASVKPKSITFDKIKDILFKTFLGRNTAGNGQVEEVTMPQARGMLNIENVDNTSDANKPVSSPQLAALNLKADLVGGLVPSSQLPAYVDDVLEFANLASFPVTGEVGKIYVALDSNKQYRWSGSSYIQITNGLIASTNDVPEGSNLYFTTSRVLATLLSGISFATGGAIVSTDSVLIAFGKIQKNITDIFTVLDLKANINTYNQSVVFDVLFNQLATGLSTNTFNSGTIFNQSDSILSALPLNRPSDIIEAHVIRGSASNANSGGTTGIGSQIPFYVGTTMLISFNQYTLTSQKSRLGVINANQTIPTTDPGGGIYIEIEDGVLVFKCATSGTITTSATTFTITDPNKWYYAMFEVESLSSIRCKIRDGFNGTVVYNEVITTNLPLSSTGSGWIQLRMSLNAITKTASNAYLIQFGRFLVSPQKPQFLNYF